MVEMQRRGVAAFVIISDAFVPLAEHSAERRGFESVPAIVLPHPLGDRPPDELRKLGRMVAERLLEGAC